MAEISKPEPCAERKRLTAERLRELLSYDTETGEFTRTRSVKGKTATSKVGCVCKTNGYVMIGVDGRPYLAHRLAWLYMTGKWPADEVDHRNRNKVDNRWINLREATRAQNNGNRLARRDSATGLKGIYWDEHRKRWCAYITANYRKKHLGRFVSKDAAIAARATAAVAMQGEFARA